jgi:hypothetical protein
MEGVSQILGNLLVERAVLRRRYWVALKKPYDLEADERGGAISIVVYLAIELAELRAKRRSLTPTLSQRERGNTRRNTCGAKQPLF